MARTKYEPGDVVYIRDDLTTSKTYCMTSGMAHDFATQKMCELKGEYVRINSIENDKYRIVEDGGVYYWVDEMFGIESREIPENYDDGFDEFIGMRVLT